jgi:hypothetical protein
MPTSITAITKKGLWMGLLGMFLGAILLTIGWIGIGMLVFSIQFAPILKKLEGLMF